jgi:2-iminobutanoate/2-iminopropanoate deaminase
MIKQVIKPTELILPSGPYSYAIKAGPFIFTSGRIGIDPITDNIAANIKYQAELIMQSLISTIQSCGFSERDVVKLTVFLQDLNDISAFDTLYTSVFTEFPPAISIIQVQELPEKALVEIELIAYKAL